MHDGSRVAYAGGTDGPPPGTWGKVLACTAAYAHVQWTEGPFQGRVGLYPVEDLAVEDRRSITASWDDSLEVGALVSLASAEEAYAETGGDGLVDHLASAGYLAAYASVAEDALIRVAQALETDPMLRQLTAAMDPQEADEVLRRAARLLISDSGDF